MKSNTPLRKLLPVLGAATVAISSAHAVDLTWDHNADGTASDGAGTWLNADQWLDGATPATWSNATPDNAIIGSGGVGGAITLGNVTAGTVLLDDFTGTYTLQGTGTTFTMNTGLTIGPDAGNVTIRGTGANSNRLTLTGNGGITMNGTGLLTLRENLAMTYTGSTVINSGVVMLGNAADRSTSNFTLNGGMLTDYYRQTHIFSSGLGTETNQIQIYGNSGFGGGNGNSTWRIGAQNSVLTWGEEGENSNASATGYFNPTALKFRAPFGDNNGPSIYGQATLQNRIDLNSGSRTIDVFRSGANLFGSSSTIANGIQDTGGAGSLTKTGGGTLFLGVNTSTWGGSTTISGGALDFGGTNLANIGGGSGRNISVAEGAVVRFNALSNAILNRIVETSDEIGVMSGTTANDLDFSSSTGANLSNAFLGNWAGNGAKMTYTGSITPGSDGYKFGALGSSGLLGITDTLSGANTLTVGQTGSSGIRVNIVAANTHSGETVINTGSKLTLGNNLALQNSALNVGASGGNFALAAGTNGGRITGETEAASPTFGGLIGSRNLSSVFTNGGGNNETNLTANLVTGFTLNVANGNTFTYSGAIGGFGTGTTNNAGGGINGDSTLTKTGLGTQILSGASTYAGGTTVSGGTLIINNTTGSGTGSGIVTVEADGTLGGTGTIAGNTTITGVHSPGNSAGIINHGADLTYNVGASVLWELVANSVIDRGTNFDGINIAGSLDFAGATEIDLSFNFTGSTVDWQDDAFWGVSYIGTDGWLIYDVAGTTTNFSNLSVNTANWLDGSGEAFDDYRSGYTFSVFQDGNDIYLNYDVIPEPSVALLGGLGLLAFFRRRRA